MPKRLEMRTQAKMCGGGPKDGETLNPPGLKAPDVLQFRAKLSPPKVHCYERRMNYKAAGYDIHIYAYVGVRALE